jgi:molybdate-binding protein
LACGTFKSASRAARKLKLDFIPLFVEDYYLLGKRETIERADIETIEKSSSRTSLLLSSRRFLVTMLRIPEN